jgi:hypothetical protein
MLGKVCEATGALAAKAGADPKNDNKIWCADAPKAASIDVLLKIAEETVLKAKGKKIFALRTEVEQELRFRQSNPCVW